LFSLFVHQIGLTNIRLGSLLLGLVVASVFLWLAISDVDYHHLNLSLQSVDRTYGLHVFVTLSLFYALKLQRWRWLIPSNIASPKMTLVTPMMAGFASNNLLPLRIGEIVRIYFAGKLLDAPKSLVLGTIVAEKLFDIIAIAVIFVAGVLVVTIKSASIDGVGIHIFLAMVIAIIAIATIIALIWFSKNDPVHLIKYIPKQWQKRLHRMVSNFSSSFGAIDSKRELIAIFANSLAQWLLLTLCIYYSIAAVAADLLNFSTAAIVLGFLVLGVTLPSAPAFIGSVEYAFVFGLGLFGYAAEQALAAAIFYHVLSFIYVILIAGICLAYYWVAIKWLPNR